MIYIAQICSVQIRAWIKKKSHQTFKEETISSAWTFETLDMNSLTSMFRRWVLQRAMSWYENVRRSPNTAPKRNCNATESSEHKQQSGDDEWSHSYYTSNVQTETGILKHFNRIQELRCLLLAAAAAAGVLVILFLLLVRRVLNLVCWHPPQQSSCRTFGNRQSLNNKLHQKNKLMEIFF